MKRAPRSSLLVYHSISVTARSYKRQLAQYLQSVRSLRRHSASCTLALVAYGKRIAPVDRRALERLGVAIHQRGSLVAAVAPRFCDEAWGRALSRYPVFHKWLSLEVLPTREFARVLYLDTDTHIMKDIHELASTRWKLVAREEPYTQRSYLRGRPYIDEELLTCSVAPFNTGVVLMSADVAHAFVGRLGEFTSNLIRFTRFMCENPSESDGPDVLYARRRGLHLGGESTPYPSRNRWIKEQIAAWMLLDAKQGFFRVDQVLQGHEFAALTPKHEPPVVVHYFSANQTLFRQWLRRWKRGHALDTR